MWQRRSWLGIITSAPPTVCFCVLRSESVTGGSEVKAVAEALDSQLSTFVGRLTALARALEQQVGMCHDTRPG
eukprot:1140753-Pelagomonas_calceolata.AAC.1